MRNDTASCSCGVPDLARRGMCSPAVTLGVAQGVARGLAALHTTRAEAFLAALAGGPERPVAYTTDDERVTRCLDRYSARMPASVSAYVAGLPERGRAAATSLGDAEVGTVHGDVHLDNLLLLDDGIVLLDWQGAGIGTQVTDIAMWLANSLPADVIAADAPKVVQGYSEARAAAGQPVSDGWDAQLQASLVSFAAGMTNWAGRVVAHPPNSREAARIVTTLERLAVLAVE